MATVGLCAAFLSAIASAIYDGKLTFTRTVAPSSTPAVEEVVETAVNYYIPKVHYVPQRIEVPTYGPPPACDSPPTDRTGCHPWHVVSMTTLLLLPIVALAIWLWLRRPAPPSVAVPAAAPDDDGTDNSGSQPVQAGDLGNNPKNLAGGEDSRRSSYATADTSAPGEAGSEQDTQPGVSVGTQTDAEQTLGHSTITTVGDIEPLSPGIATGSMLTQSNVHTVVNIPPQSPRTQGSNHADELNALRRQFEQLRQDFEVSEVARAVAEHDAKSNEEALQVAEITHQEALQVAEIIRQEQRDFLTNVAKNEIGLRRDKNALLEKTIADLRKRNDELSKRNDELSKSHLNTPTPNQEAQENEPIAEETVSCFAPAPQEQAPNAQQQHANNDEDEDLYYITPERDLRPRSRAPEAHEGALDEDLAGRGSPEPAKKRHQESHGDDVEDARELGHDGKPDDDQKQEDDQQQDGQQQDGQQQDYQQQEDQPQDDQPQDDKSSSSNEAGEKQKDDGSSSSSETKDQEQGDEDSSSNEDDDEDDDEDSDENGDKGSGEDSDEDHGNDGDGGAGAISSTPSSLPSEQSNDSPQANPDPATSEDDQQQDDRHPTSNEAGKRQQEDEALPFNDDDDDDSNEDHGNDGDGGASTIPLSSASPPSEQHRASHESNPDQPPFVGVQQPERTLVDAGHTAIHAESDDSSNPAGQADSAVETGDRRPIGGRRESNRRKAMSQMRDRRAQWTTKSKAKTILSRQKSQTSMHTTTQPPQAQPDVQGPTKELDSVIAAMSALGLSSGADEMDLSAIEGESGVPAQQDQPQETLENDLDMGEADAEAVEQQTTPVNGDGNAQLEDVEMEEHEAAADQNPSTYDDASNVIAPQTQNGADAHGAPAPDGWQQEAFAVDTFNDPNLPAEDNDWSHQPDNAPETAQPPSPARSESSSGSFQQANEYLDQLPDEDDEDTPMQNGAEEPAELQNGPAQSTVTQNGAAQDADLQNEGPQSNMERGPQSQGAGTPREEVAPGAHHFDDYDLQMRQFETYRNTMDPEMLGYLLRMLMKGTGREPDFLFTDGKPDFTKFTQEDRERFFHNAEALDARIKPQRRDSFDSYLDAEDDGDNREGNGPNDTGEEVPKIGGEEDAQQTPGDPSNSESMDGISRPKMPTRGSGLPRPPRPSSTASGTALTLKKSVKRRADQDDEDESNIKQTRLSVDQTAEEQQGGVRGDDNAGAHHEDTVQPEQQEEAPQDPAPPVSDSNDQGEANAPRPKDDQENGNDQTENVDHQPTEEPTQKNPEDFTDKELEDEANMDALLASYRNHRVEEHHNRDRPETGAQDAFGPFRGRDNRQPTSSQFTRQPGQSGGPATRPHWIPHNFGESTRQIPGVSPWTQGANLPPPTSPSSNLPQNRHPMSTNRSTDTSYNPMMPSGGSQPPGTLPSANDRASTFEDAYKAYLERVQTVNGSANAPARTTAVQNPSRPAAFSNTMPTQPRNAPQNPPNPPAIPRMGPPPSGHPPPSTSPFHYLNQRSSNNANQPWNPPQPPPNPAANTRMIPPPSWLLPPTSAFEPSNNPTRLFNAPQAPSNPAANTGVHPPPPWNPSNSIFHESNNPTRLFNAPSQTPATQDAPTAAEEPSNSPPRDGETREAYAARLRRYNKHQEDLREQKRREKAEREKKTAEQKRRLDERMRKKAEKKAEENDHYAKFADMDWEDIDKDEEEDMGGS
ncbi:hypothetical protein PRZ48_002471 [Zasmidium cellare]|uniref:Uncharacterized protein n=1 Tax=Zasmidium cellare TaxID=395010 RepID=A0ABR0F4W1_ZASCE|nr:hypothetical protein PRZ48_002471 [Zasmidium cellare]